MWYFFFFNISVWATKWRVKFVKSYLANSTTAENWLKSVASSELKIRFNECCPTTFIG